MKILAMDSSACSASVALWEDGRILGECFVNNGLTHSQTLLPMVESLLAHSRVKIGEIGLFAVSAGPGSFTGIRIGVAAIKGWRWRRTSPARAFPPCRQWRKIFPVWKGLSALPWTRCGQVYNALFDVSAGRITRLCDDRALSLEDLGAELSALQKNVFLLEMGLICVIIALKQHQREQVSLRSPRSICGCRTPWASLRLENCFTGRGFLSRPMSFARFICVFRRPNGNCGSGSAL